MKQNGLIIFLIVILVVFLILLGTSLFFALNKQPSTNTFVYKQSSQPTIKEIEYCVRQYFGLTKEMIEQTLILRGNSQIGSLADTNKKVLEDAIKALSDQVSRANNIFAVGLINS